MTGGCKYRPVSLKRNLNIEKRVVVSECIVCYRVVAY